MARLRKMQRLAAWLVGVFLIAQFAGVVPRPAYAAPQPASAAQHYNHKPAQDHAEHKSHYPDNQHGNIADQCCALHLLTGLVPLVLAALPTEVRSLTVQPAASTEISGLHTSPLDRPPRSLLSI